MEKLLVVIERERYLAIIAGDYNYDLLELGKDKYVLSFVNLLSSYGFLPTISKPTRVYDEKNHF